MKNEKIIESWSRIDPDDERMNAMLNSILEKRENQKNSRGGAALFRGLAAACVLVIIGAVSVFAAEAIRKNSARVSVEKGKEDSDKKNTVSYIFDKDYLQMSADEITGQVNECKSIIREQVRTHDILSSQGANSVHKQFESIESVETYIGCNAVAMPGMSGDLQKIDLDVVGDSDGDFTYISIWANYSVSSDLSYVSMAYIFTEKYGEAEINLGIQTWSDAFDGAEIEGKTVSMDENEFFQAYSDYGNSGWRTLNVFFEKDKVVYKLAIRFKTGLEAEAEKIAEEWMKGF